MRIATILALLCAALSPSCLRRSAELPAEIYSFYNYSAVNWAMLDTLYYRPYTADWSDDIASRFADGFPQDVAAGYWHLLQNARTYFHQRSLPARASSSKTVRRALDRTEAMFDTIFVRIVAQEYYMRLFVDVYNAVMPQAIDELCDVVADGR